MKRCALCLAFVLAASPALAQRAPDQKGKRQGTTKAERQQMRDDMRQAYKDKGQRQERRQLSPEQREGLRRDMQDANRNLKKR
jgi:hypothetical protein